MNLPPKLRIAVERAGLGGIRRVEPMAGGDISAAALIEDSSGRKLFLKWNPQAPEGFFECERRGLLELGTCEVVTVPRVVAVSSADEPGFLLLEALTPGERSSEAEARLGRALAAMHRLSRASFGFDHNNFIGRTPQTNTPEDRWGDFFVRHRLEAQLRIGLRRGWITPSLQKDIEQIAEPIRDCLNGVGEPPALLHGDLWSGNVFWSTNGPVLIDPAVYYGNREADIAFTELFGGFGLAFSTAYRKAYPLAEDYEDRRDLLNLYHLMNHANLFGGSYIGWVERVVLQLRRAFF